MRPCDGGQKTSRLPGLAAHTIAEMELRIPGNQYFTKELLSGWFVQSNRPWIRERMLYRIRCR